MGACTAETLLHSTPLHNDHRLLGGQRAQVSTRGAKEGARAGCAGKLANPENVRPSLLGDKSRPAGGTGSGGLGSAFKMASPQGDSDEASEPAPVSVQDGPTTERGAGAAG